MPVLALQLDGQIVSYLETIRKGVPVWTSERAWAWTNWDHKHAAACRAYAVANSLDPNAIVVLE